MMLGMSNSGTPKDLITVLVTGFGPFLDVKDNPSARILELLPESIVHQDKTIGLVKAPVLQAVYSHLLTTTPALLERHQPDLGIHIGPAVDRDYFAIEEGANRDGYHEIPDEERKVLNRAENKRFFGRSAASLDSSVLMDEGLLTRWEGLVTGSGFGKERKRSKSKTPKEEMMVIFN